MVEKFLGSPASNIPGVHAPHPSYSNRKGGYFDSLFADIKSRYDFTKNSELLKGMEEFHEKLMELRYNIKQEIVNKSIKGNTKIDDLWNGNNFNNVIPN